MTDKMYFSTKWSLSCHGAKIADVFEAVCFLALILFFFLKMSKMSAKSFLIDFE